MQKRQDNNVIQYPAPEYVPRHRQREHIDNLQEPYFYRVEGAQRNIENMIQNLYKSIVLLNHSMQEQRTYNTTRIIADIVVLLGILFLMIGPKIFDI